MRLIELVGSDPITASFSTSRGVKPIDITIAAVGQDLVVSGCFFCYIIVYMSIFRLRSQVFQKVVDII